MPNFTLADTRVHCKMPSYISRPWGTIADLRIQRAKGRIQTLGVLPHARYESFGSIVEAYTSFGDLRLFCARLHVQRYTYHIFSQGNTASP